MMSSTSSGARRKLHFSGLPLQGKSFYLDIKGATLKKRISERVTALGGLIECFLSKDVYLLVTDKANGKKDDQNSKEKRGTGLNVQALGQNVPLSRGQALLLKSSKQQQIQDLAPPTHDVIQKAVAMGIKTESTSAFLRATTKLLTKMKARDVDENENGAVSPIDWKHKDKENIYIVKVEDAEDKYRPLFKQFDVAPKITFSETGCPFDTGVVLEKKPVDTNNQSKRKSVGGALRGGYCESCDHWYKCTLREHLKSTKHQDFVNKHENFLLLDSTTNALPNLGMFLGQYKLHCTQPQNLTMLNISGPSTNILCQIKCNPEETGNMLIPAQQQQCSTQCMSGRARHASRTDSRAMSISDGSFLHSINAKSTPTVPINQVDLETTNVRKKFVSCTLGDSGSRIRRDNSTDHSMASAPVELTDMEDKTEDFPVNAHDENSSMSVGNNSCPFKPKSFERNANHLVVIDHTKKDPESVCIQSTGENLQFPFVPEAAFSSSSHSFGDPGVDNVLSYLNNARSQNSVKSIPDLDFSDFSQFSQKQPIEQISRLNPETDGTKTTISEKAKVSVVADSCGLKEPSYKETTRTVVPSVIESSNESGISSLQQSQVQNSCSKVKSDENLLKENSLNEKGIDSVSFNNSALERTMNVDSHRSETDFSDFSFSSRSRIASTGSSIRNWLLPNEDSVGVDCVSTISQAAGNEKATLSDIVLNQSVNDKTLTGSQEKCDSFVENWLENQSFQASEIMEECCDLTFVAKESEQLEEKHHNLQKTVGQTLESNVPEQVNSSIIPTDLPKDLPSFLPVDSRDTASGQKETHTSLTQNEYQTVSPNKSSQQQSNFIQENFQSVINPEKIQIIQENFVTGEKDNHEEKNDIALSVVETASKATSKPATKQISKPKNAKKSTAKRVSKKNTKKLAPKPVDTPVGHINEIINSQHTQQGSGRFIDHRQNQVFHPAESNSGQLQFGQSGHYPNMLPTNLTNDYRSMSNYPASVSYTGQQGGQASYQCPFYSPVSLASEPFNCSPRPAYPSPNPHQLKQQYPNPQEDRRSPWAFGNTESNFVNSMMGNNPAHQSGVGVQGQNSGLSFTAMDGRGSPFTGTFNSTPKQTTLHNSVNQQASALTNADMNYSQAGVDHSNSNNCTGIQSHHPAGFSGTMEQQSTTHNQFPSQQNMTWSTDISRQQTASAATSVGVESWQQELQVPNFMTSDSNFFTHQQSNSQGASVNSVFDGGESHQDFLQSTHSWNSLYGYQDSHSSGSKPVHLETICIEDIANDGNSNGYFDQVFKGPTVLPEPKPAKKLAYQQQKKNTSRKSKVKSSKMEDSDFTFAGNKEQPVMSFTPPVPNSGIIGQDNTGSCLNQQSYIHQNNEVMQSPCHQPQTSQQLPPTSGVFNNGCTVVPSQQSTELSGNSNYSMPSFVKPTSNFVESGGFGANQSVSFDANSSLPFKKRNRYMAYTQTSAEQVNTYNVNSGCVSGSYDMCNNSMNSVPQHCQQTQILNSVSQENWNQNPGNASPMGQANVNPIGQADVTVPGNGYHSNFYCVSNAGDTKLRLCKVSSASVSATDQTDLHRFWQVRKAGDCRLVFSAPKRKADDQNPDHWDSDMSNTDYYGSAYSPNFHETEYQSAKRRKYYIY